MLERVQVMRETDGESAREPTARELAHAPPELRVTRLGPQVITAAEGPCERAAPLLRSGRRSCHCLPFAKNSTLRMCPI